MNFYQSHIMNRKNLYKIIGLVIMNLNEEKLRQISVTINTLNMKKELTDSEKELKEHMEAERKQILKLLD